MGLFNKLFNSDSTESKSGEGKKSTGDLPWIELNTLAQLDEIKERSKTKTQFIFKHSTRCGVSRMVISQFKKDYQLEESQADLYYLDLLNHRDISNGIASQFNVMHESPQLLVLKNGAVVKHDSHGGINNLNFETFI
ncbi:bacillithiol system redox-active protein YtxJ [Gelidibacter salicanalis]|uniref:Bacillithiol system redox-active protein YtxJ n=1 Tax=Gelidibacter salicanalis TaxID=291193 RepID=A0A5C7AJJ8_9FLAO|nr:bacillithiol system redox-active protein YtxJ [Gelidibacter salicanalis]TXE07693.1 bacillithiol system redox-active protein YtxJ [Gelidibacter salicanalis]